MTTKLLCDSYPEGAYKPNIKGDILFTRTYLASYNLLHQLYNVYRESLVSSQPLSHSFTRDRAVSSLPQGR